MKIRAILFKFLNKINMINIYYALLDIVGFNIEAELLL